MDEHAEKPDGRLNVAFIGFGEAAGAFVTGWSAAITATLREFDIKTEAGGPDCDRKLADYRASGVDGCMTRAEAVAGADVVFSMVTADQADAAARSTAAALSGPALFFDCNSCAPETKRNASEIITAAGSRYVDVAVMAPVHPGLHRTPVLVSGPHAGEALQVMRALDMSATEVPGDVGAASAIKLCRSIMVKGLEALSAELLLTACTYGVEEPVLASLEASHPGFGWARRTARSLERMMVHGERRAAEMREAATMIDAVGVPGHMTRSTVAWQQQVGGLRLAADTGAPERNVEILLKALGGRG